VVGCLYPPKRGGGSEGGWEVPSPLPLSGSGLPESERMARDYDVARSLQLSFFMQERVGVAKLRLAIYRRENSGPLELLEEWHYPPGAVEPFALPKVAEYLSLWLLQTVEDVWDDELDYAARTAGDIGEQLTLPTDS
jgi:hypothetical protein